MRRLQQSQTKAVLQRDAEHRHDDIRTRLRTSRKHCVEAEADDGNHEESTFEIPSQPKSLRHSAYRGCHQQCLRAGG